MCNCVNMIKHLSETNILEFNLTFNYGISDAEILKINLNRLKHNVKTIIYLQENKIVGTASYFVELKFLHNGGKVMHIEDVVVNDEYKSLGIGKKLILYLTGLAKNAKCYKIILDCSEKNVGFYEKCGFKRRELQMRKDL